MIHKSRVRVRAKSDLMMTLIAPFAAGMFVMSRNGFLVGCGLLTIVLLIAARELDAR